MDKQEEMQLIASLTNQVNQASAELDNKMMEAPVAGGMPQRIGRVDGNQLLNQVARTETPSAHYGNEQDARTAIDQQNSGQYHNNVQPAYQPPQVAQPPIQQHIQNLDEVNVPILPQPTQQASSVVTHRNVATPSIDVTIPPTILTALLRKVSSMEITINKQFEILEKLLDKKKAPVKNKEE